MTVEHLDYGRLLAYPSVRSAFEEKVKSTIASEVGHGTSPAGVRLHLRPGSVAVRASVGALPRGAAEAVRAQLSASEAFSTRMSRSLVAVQGIDAASTGPISVTNVGAVSTGDARQGAGSGWSPERGLAVAAYAGVVACGLLLVLLLKRLRDAKAFAEGGAYAIAADEEEERGGGGGRVRVVEALKLSSLARVLSPRRAGDAPAPAQTAAPNVPLMHKEAQREAAPAKSRQAQEGSEPKKAPAEPEQRLSRESSQRSAAAASPRGAPARGRG